MKCKNLFSWENNENIFSMSSAENFTQITKHLMG